MPSTSSMGYASRLSQLIETDPARKSLDMAFLIECEGTPTSGVALVAVFEYTARVTVP